MNSSNAQVNIRIGGEAGLGIATGADILARLLLNCGYEIFSSKEYYSQIKGGHNFHNIRASLSLIGADVDKVDLLLALDERTLLEHIGKVSAKSFIFYDTRIDPEKTDARFLPLDVKKVIEELKQKKPHNAIFVGATTKLLGISWEELQAVVDKYFANKPELREIFLSAARRGYEEVKEAQLKIDLINPSKKINRELWTGNDAITFGALKAGLKFHAQYPMTPVSGILHNLALEAQYNKELTVIQPEDEIAGINMALGASFAGARAMVATSGGGFALMVEALGLAGGAEIPLVIIEGQRPGPGTGVPTKTEQGDLKFVISAGTGEFPRVVIAPGDVEECFTETKRAFYLAEKYQVPVIVIIDKHLAESYKTLDVNAEEKKLVIDFKQRWNMVTDGTEVKDNELNKDGLYKRYALGTLRRTIPGVKSGMYTCAGDEHDEVGEITEDVPLRIAMMKRRMEKMEAIEKEIPAPGVIGIEKADVTIVGWGSTKSAIAEAVERLNAESKNTKVNFLALKYMLPFSSWNVKKILEKSKRIILVENNYTGQLGELIQEKTGLALSERILRYDGKTFSADEIYAELKKII